MKQSESEAPVKPTTKFNQLMLTAYREFQGVSQDLVLELRKTHQLKVVQHMDNYAKRSVVRNLNFNTPFSKDDLFYMCDQFFGVQFYDSGNKKASERLQLPQFQRFMGKVAAWANTQPDLDEQQSRGAVPKPISGASFIDKIFDVTFDLNHDGFVDFPDIVKGLRTWVFSDLDALILLFFRVHDANDDGRLTKEETIQLSESLLFILRRDDNDKYLDSVSSLMTKMLMLFESDPENASLLIQGFSELVKGDPLLLHFFSQGLSASFTFKDVQSGVKQTVMKRDPAESLFKSIKWTGRLQFKKSEATLKQEEKKGDTQVKTDEVKNVETVEIKTGEVGSLKSTQDLDLLDQGTVSNDCNH